MADLDEEIRLAYSSGKVLIGYKRTVKELKSGREDIKLIIIAKNAPKNIKDEITYLAKLANIPVVEYPGKSLELGRILRKPFFVSSLAVIDPGESSILKII